MNWVLIGLLSGSLITSQHETREQCEGRKVILQEQKATKLKCVELEHWNGITNGSVLKLSPSTVTIPTN
jgi:hypothetical protein